MSQANSLGSSDQGATIMARFMKSMRSGGQQLTGAGGESAAQLDQGIKSIMDAVSGEGNTGTVQPNAIAVAPNPNDRGVVV